MGVLCLREFQNSIDDSVHSALKEEIEVMDMTNFYTYTNNGIDGINGSKFRYAQLARNLASIKSKHGFKIAWVEEASVMSAKSLEFLVPTIRKSGSELWFSLNLDDEEGAVYCEYIRPHLKAIEKNGFYEDDDVYIRKINMDENPFAPAELIRESEKMKEKNYKKWLHVYNGDPNTNFEDAIMQPEWVNAAVDAHKKIQGWEAMGIKSVGFDPADEGKDAKALVLRHGSIITKCIQWDTGDIDKAVDKAFQFADDWRADALVYDSDGLGAGVKVGLDKRIEGKRIDVSAFYGNAKVDNPYEDYDLTGDKRRTMKDMFKNKRSQYIRLLADRFERTYNAVENGVWSDPETMISLSSDIEDLDQLKSELSRWQRKKGNNTFYQVESKQDMKGRGYESPNMSDGLGYCFANPPPKPVYEELTFTRYY